MGYVRLDQAYLTYPMDWGGHLNTFLTRAGGVLTTGSGLPMANWLHAKRRVSGVYTVRQFYD